MTPREEHFWSKVNKTDDCWVWQGGQTPFGYGHFYWHKRRFAAHRVAWELQFGPPVKCILHRCDNPACVRPSHLFEGTRTENMQDCISKGRANHWGNRRRTHCRHGHEFTPENTYRSPNRPESRLCRTCHRLHVRAQRLVLEYAS